jgi:hypothetical protein
MAITQPLQYSTPAAWQHEKDRSHLNTLAICHYVAGGLTVLFSSVFIIHGIMGIAVLTDPTFFGGANPPPPAWFGWIFAIMGFGAVALGWTLGGLTIYSGRCIHRRRRRIFSIVIAALHCANFPLGTVLGVFTIIVLVRPSVAEIYRTPPAPAGAA